MNKYHIALTGSEVEIFRALLSLLEINEITYSLAKRLDAFSKLPKDPGNVPVVLNTELTVNGLPITPEQLDIQIQSLYIDEVLKTRPRAKAS